MSSFDVNWDVEKYKFLHETKEHWQLRKNFLLAHKERFPEEELVCLAQVFVNVELLGCRYPQETMELIRELSEDVAEDFRTQRQSKLQRTFVKASDAASSKAKGLNSSKTPLSYRDFQPSSTHNQEMPEPPKKMKRNIFGNAPFGRIVIFERPDENPHSVLTRVSGSFDVNFDWKPNETKLTWSIYTKNKLVAKASGTSQKEAKAAVAAAAVSELKKYYYTIKIKAAFITNEEAMSSDSLLKKQEENNVLGDDNIGNKLMKLMGWSGGGLGKSQQGIVEPVNVQQHVNRKGLGLTSGNLQELKAKCREVIRKFLKGDMRYDLVFASDFTNEERAAMHVIARQMGVKSRSHGPKDNRTLVLSRKIDPESLVLELEQLGGSTDKYQLVKPSQ